MWNKLKPRVSLAIKFAGKIVGYIFIVATIFICGIALFSIEALVQTPLQEELAPVKRWTKEHPGEVPETQRWFNSPARQQRLLPKNHEVK